MPSINMKALHQKVREAHQRIVVGDRYFLSVHHDKEGCIVRVVSKSDRVRNRAGFYSIVNVEILSSDVTHPKNYYGIGEVHTVNAANLYTDRYFASPEHKYRSNQ
jgi:putative ribosome biogenesis GTPase RsgA